MPTCTLARPAVQKAPSNCSILSNLANSLSPPSPGPEHQAGRSLILISGEDDSIENDRATASTNQHQLSRVEFSNRFVGLLGNERFQIAALDFDDVRVDADVVHGWLRPLRFCGLPALDCTSRTHSGGVRLS